MKLDTIALSFILAVREVVNSRVTDGIACFRARRDVRSMVRLQLSLAGELQSALARLSFYCKVLWSRSDDSSCRSRLKVQA